RCEDVPYLCHTPRVHVLCVVARHHRHARPDRAGAGAVGLENRRVGKGALATYPPSNIALVMVGTLRFAHPTKALRALSLKSAGGAEAPEILRGDRFLRSGSNAEYIQRTTHCPGGGRYP